MSNLNNIKYTYHYDWSYESKCGAGSLQVNEALEKFNNFKTLFVVAQKINEDKPFAYIMITNKDSFYIHVLNDKLDTEREYKYQILHNLEENKLFLIESMIRKYDYFNIKLYQESFSYIKKVYSYRFAGNNEESNFQWFIFDKVLCKETDYIEEESITYKSKNIIDKNSLWENIPEFGNWDYFLRDDNNKVKFTEVRD